MSGVVSDLEWRAVSAALADAERRIATAIDVSASLRRRSQVLSVVEAQRDGLRRLVEYALRLRMYGECAPGGDETWGRFDRDAEEFLRALPAADECYSPVRVPENTGKHQGQSGETRTHSDTDKCPTTCGCRATA